MPNYTNAPYATRHSTQGMVCSIDHLASGAGIEVMRQGGNAADAAVAASAVLAVTCQHMCGMGGDLWALIHFEDGQPPLALNASGRAGSGANPDTLRRDGLLEMPFHNDPRSIPVPGCVDGWVAINTKLGNLNLAKVLAPAISLAFNGFPISSQCATACRLLKNVANTDDYMRHGLPSTGDLITRSGVARTLEAIAENGRRAFYEGQVGKSLIEFGMGEYSEDDLVRNQSDWVNPISIEAWGHRVWTVPPNSQGYLTLAAAWISSQLDLPEDPDNPLYTHLLSEAVRQSGYDRPDELHEFADPEKLLSLERLNSRVAAISKRSVSDTASGINNGDTIYLNAVDSNRMAVSLIQSNASGWGALQFLPESKISLHNRGLGFSTQKGHKAEYGPGRRPPHTLAPALVQRLDGSIRAVLGTMGGDSQPQIVLQLLARLLHSKQEPGDAIAAARWRFAGNNRSGFHTWANASDLVLQLEGHNTVDASALQRLGHDIEYLGEYDSAFGHAHLIEVQENILAGAADPRALAGGVAGY
ncbi:MAG: gamma-glutamyltranspeptidase [Actinobacteria bacterium]|nr:gamma-glutamyltranspeptidase [Actinomycetota bacterium]